MVYSPIFPRPPQTFRLFPLPLRSTLRPIPAERRHFIVSLIPSSYAMTTHSSTFSPSLSFQLLKARMIPNRVCSFRFDPVCISNSNYSVSSKKPVDLICTNCEPLNVRSSFIRSFLSNPVFRPSLIAGRGSEDDLVVRASSAVPETAGETPKSSSVANMLQLGLWFALWYIFNIYFNIYNKQVLKVYNFPVTLTVVQLVVGSSLAFFMWTFNLYKRPKVTRAQLVAILPLAMLHTLGNLFTNMSLGKVAVSFTHTIKALEPFFSVILSTIFLGELPSPWVVLSLTPIVGGVALASMTEVSFNWGGFWSAMASNLANQSRNVLSKKVMDSLDNINLFSIITIMSLILMAPAAFVMEGITFTPAYLEAAGLNVSEVYTRTLMASLCFHAYQQLSYMILEKVSPVTHSVGNCVKRVVVIVSSVIFFRTPVSFINSLGTGVALAGVFLYSQLKRIKVKSNEA